MSFSHQNPYARQGHDSDQVEMENTLWRSFRKVTYGIVARAKRGDYKATMQFCAAGALCFGAYKLYQKYDPSFYITDYVEIKKVIYIPICAVVQQLSDSFLTPLANIEGDNALNLSYHQDKDRTTDLVQEDREIHIVDIQRNVKNEITPEDTFPKQQHNPLLVRNVAMPYAEATATGEPSSSRYNQPSSTPNDVYEENRPRVENPNISSHNQPHAARSQPPRGNNPHPHRERVYQQRQEPRRSKVVCGSTFKNVGSVKMEKSGNTVIINKHFYLGNLSQDDIIANDTFEDINGEVNVIQKNNVVNLTEL